MAEEKKIGITVKKKDDFSEWYTQLIEQAELADVRYGIKGFVVYREWAQVTIEKMYRSMMDALDRKGHMPLCFPTLIHEKNFELEAEHVEGFTPDVFWVTQAGSEKLNEKYALRPTSETAFYQMYSLWLRSHRDLPYKRYQRASVFRAEKTKGTRPFLRGREFHWIETHNAFATHEDAYKQVLEDMEITREVLGEEFAIPHIFFERPQWDKFPGAVSTFAADALMGSGKVLQLPSTHLLGENFSKPFNVTYVAENGEQKYCHLTCYGPAISRIYGAMIALHSDDKGLRVPFNMAPLQVVIVPIPKEGADNKAILKKAEKLSKDLGKKYSVKIDDRDEYTPGWKYNYYELKGVPMRIEVGPRDLENGTVIIARRDTGKKELTKDPDVVKAVDKIAGEYTENLLKQADEGFEKNIVHSKSVEEIKKALSENKIASAGFCSIGMDGAKCAEKIDLTGGEVRGKRMDKEEKPKGNCVSCDKPAKLIVYVAKSY